MPRTFDLDDGSLVLIIGSGAGGGTLGNELAQKGIRTLILEAGPRLEREQHMMMSGNRSPSWLGSINGPLRDLGGLPRIIQTFPRMFAKSLAAQLCIGVGARCGSRSMNSAPKMCTVISREPTF